MFIYLVYFVALLLEHGLEEILLLSMSTTNRTAELGLEVSLPTNPEVVAQPYENMYYAGDGRSRIPVLDQPDHPISDQSPQAPSQPHAKIQGRSRIVLVLAAIAVLCLIAAIGAGLGAGLAAQRNSSQAR